MIKRLLASILTGLVLVTLSFAPLGFSGCAGANSTAYKAVKATDVSAETAMRVWNDYVGQFHPGVDAERKVKAAWEKYNKALATAADAGSAWSKAAQNGDAPDAKTAYLAALNVVSSSLGDLIDLIRSFGAKI